MTKRVMSRREVNKPTMLSFDVPLLSNFIGGNDHGELPMSTIRVPSEYGVLLDHLLEQYKSLYRNKSKHLSKKSNDWILSHWCAGNWAL